MPGGLPRRSGRSAIAEPQDVAAGLTPLARLALAYAPARTRDDWLTLLALDARLAGVVTGAREPMLAQLKLAWWRDRLGSAPATWPKGEPLLARLAAWDDPSALVALVDGWEALLDEPPLTEAAVLEFAEGRAAALGELARRSGAETGPARQAARRWSLAELALGEPEGVGIARAMATTALSGERLPRALRPLAVLDGVTRKALANGGAAALYRPASWFTALRIGLIGR